MEVMLSWSVSTANGAVSTNSHLTGPAFARLVAGQASSDDEAMIARCIAATRPCVLVIWLGLLASAALGLRLI